MYGEIAIQLATYLAQDKDYKVHILPLQYGPTKPLLLNGVYIVGLNEGIHGAEALSSFLSLSKPDVLITMCMPQSLSKLDAKAVRWIAMYDSIDSPFLDGVPEEADAIVTNTKYIKKKLKEELFLDAHYIPATIEGAYAKEDTTESRKSLGLPAEPFYVGVLSNNLMYEQIPTVVMAFSMAFQNTPVKLSFLCAPYRSNGTMIPEVCKLFKVLDQTTFLMHSDELSPSQMVIKAWLNSCNIVCTASTGSIDYRLALQAMATGRPIIYNGGNPILKEVIGDAGLPIKSNMFFRDIWYRKRWCADPVAMKEAMVELYNNSKLREELSSKAVDRYRDYSPAVVLPKWKRLIEEVVS